MSDELVSSDALVTLPEGLNIVSFARGSNGTSPVNVLLTANVLASLADQGLRARVVPVVGFEWAF